MVDVKTVAVIGAGQIGLRHLEALRGLDRVVALEIADPRPEALNAAVKVVEGAHRIVPVNCHPDLSGLPPELDLAIIATTAEVRFAVLAELLSRVKLKNLILEKVLFQKLSHYDRAAALLAENRVQAWVNCPWRTAACFRDLPALFAGSPLNYYACATHLGLGCNSIHHLDLYAFISGRYDLTLKAGLLDDSVIESKRPGFCELTGTLTGQGEDGGTIRISSYTRGAMPLQIAVFSAEARIILWSTAQTAWCATAKSGWLWRDYPCPLPRQSEVTGPVIRQIFDTGTCNLPTFEQSAALHRPLILTLAQKFGDIKNGEDPLCPIT